MAEIPVPGFELVAHVRAELGPVHSLGHGPWGERRVVPILGGSVEGSLLQARILAEGADWQVVQPDGTISVDARYTLETRDGAGIYVRSRGVRQGPAEVLERLAAGEPVDPSEYYFRAAIELETGAPEYAWVNKRLFVASAMRLASAVAYDLYSVT